MKQLYFNYDEVRKHLKEIVINKNLNLQKASGTIFWLSMLDYTKDTSHSEYSILDKIINDDLDEIRNAMNTLNKYIELDIDVI
jgi:hypothetical protein